MFEFTLIPKKSEPTAAETAYDVVIIGGGAAGFSTAIYTARDGLKTLVLEKSTTGGLAGTTELIENYAGFPEGINGMELLARFRQQAERFGTTVAEFAEVLRLEPLAPGQITIHTTDQVYRARAVVIATGSHPKHLNVPGEAELYGRGLSYCATCDGPLFRDKAVVVIGAGNSGLQESANLVHYVKSVTIVEFLPTSKAEKILQERVFGHPKVQTFFNHQVIAIEGTTAVTGVRVQDRTTGAERVIPAEGVFIYAGYQPETGFVQGLLELDRWGYIKTDTHLRTSVPGIFAAGDVRADNVAQVAVAVGDGARAALAVREYLAGLSPA